jgi:hypothetical protein
LFNSSGATKSKPPCSTPKYDRPARLGPEQLAAWKPNEIG